MDKDQLVAMLQDVERSIIVITSEVDELREKRKGADRQFIALSRIALRLEAVRGTVIDAKTLVVDDSPTS